MSTETYITVLFIAFIALLTILDIGLFGPQLFYTVAVPLMR